MQRKVHSRNKSDDAYTKGNGRMINIIFTIVSIISQGIVVFFGK